MLAITSHELHALSILHAAYIHARHAQLVHSAALAHALPAHSLVYHALLYLHAKHAQMGSISVELTALLAPLAAGLAKTMTIVTLALMATLQLPPMELNSAPLTASPAPPIVKLVWSIAHNVIAATKDIVCLILNAIITLIWAISFSSTPSTAIL